jgi:hypothetical protein
MPTVRRRERVPAASGDVPQPEGVRSGSSESLAYVELDKIEKETLGWLGLHALELRVLAETQNALEAERDRRLVYR